MVPMQKRMTNLNLEAMIKFKLIVETAGTTKQSFA
jgi:hypothetical protein